MTMRILSTGGRVRYAVVLMSALLGLNVLTAAGQTKKPAAPAKPAAAPAKPAAPASKPGTPSTAGGAKTPTATTSGGGTKAPMANGGGGASKTPMANGGGGTKTPTAGGGGTKTPTTSASKGAVTPKGVQTHTAANGAKVSTRPGGGIRDIHDEKRGMDIHHGLDGSRRVSVTRRDGSRLVAQRGRAGYVERGFQYHGHDFARRSYYFHGREYDRFYRGYGYNGVMLNVYAPGYYYGAGFYGWAYNPWAVPVAYGWGWGGNPWFGFYGGFFTPWAVYPNASFWLADYVLSQNLAAAYAAQAGGDVPAGIAIAPAQPWTDASTQVTQGQTYTITASGILNYSGSDPRAVAPPAGRFDPNCLPGQVHGGFAAPQLPCWSLIGKIGADGVPFEVGYGRTIVAPASGELFLGVNDNNYPDNSGGWVASISQPGAGGGTTATATAQPAGDGPALTPEVKQLIATEVKNQIALENAEATQTAANQDVDPKSSGIARMLGDGQPHMFVVGDGVDVTEASSGQECHLSDGDALELATPPPGDATAATLTVKASKGGNECVSGGNVQVTVADLQEMQNHMRENIDDGLKELQAKQGQGGLPAAPPSAKAPPTQCQFAAIQPPPPPQDAADIQAQTAQADQAEAEAKGGSPSASNPAPSVTVAVNQTPGEVQALLGPPSGETGGVSQVVYFYGRRRITFQGGKVSEVD